MNAPVRCCDNCGTSFDGAQRFCGDCGQPTDRSSSIPVVMISTPLAVRRLSAGGAGVDARLLGRH